MSYARGAAVLVLVAWMAMLAAPAPARAQSTQDTLPAATTGDAWLDARLTDMAAYAGRYPQAFVDELVRYQDAPRAAVQQWLAAPQTQAGDVYYACALAQALDRPCTQVWRIWQARTPEQDWAALGTTLEVDAAVRLRIKAAIAGSYRHWARPLTPDAELRRYLQRAAAAADR